MKENGHTNWIFTPILEVSFLIRHKSLCSRRNRLVADECDAFLGRRKEMRTKEEKYGVMDQQEAWRDLWIGR